MTRAKLAAYFKAEGYRVSEAEDGAEMRDILADRPADLLLIDIQLPGEDGLQLTRELRERSEVGIILVTGRSDTVDRIVGLEIGADDYVTKPFDQRELLEPASKTCCDACRQASSGSRTKAQIRKFLGWTLDLGNRTLIDKRRRLHRPDAGGVQGAGSLLSSNPGKVLSRDRLLHEIAAPRLGSLRPHGRCRYPAPAPEAHDDSRHPRIIVTSHGEGYLFATTPDRPG